MQTFVNRTGKSLSMAVWLATDTYDYDHRENYISATSLLKPTRQLILSTRLEPEQKLIEVGDMVPSRMGTAIHDSFERAWLTNYRGALLSLGYPQSVVDRVVVNKPFEELTPNDIPVYLEKRSEREIDGFVIGGKFDFVGEGIVEDLKSTTVYKYITETSDEAYRLQGSIYRWLNPKIITANYMRIQFVFTDWSKKDAIQQASRGYPQHRQLEKRIQLMSLAETEQWIRNRLKEIKRLKEVPESEIPHCTDKELWRSNPVYKYFKKPGQSRSTRTSENYQEVFEAYLKNNSVGEIVTVPGEVKACRTCPSFPICTQKDAYLDSGELTLNSQ